MKVYKKEFIETAKIYNGFRKLKAVDSRGKVIGYRKDKPTHAELVLDLQLNGKLGEGIAIDGGVYSIFYDAGYFYVGGRFTTVDGQEGYKNLCRIGYGEVDTSFKSTGTGWGVPILNVFKHQSNLYVTHQPTIKYPTTAPTFNGSSYPVGASKDIISRLIGADKDFDWHFTNSSENATAFLHYPGRNKVELVGSDLFVGPLAKVNSRMRGFSYNFTEWGSTFEFNGSGLKAGSLGIIDDILPAGSLLGSQLRNSNVNFVLGGEASFFEVLGAYGGKMLVKMVFSIVTGYEAYAYFLIDLASGGIQRLRYTEFVGNTAGSVVFGFPNSVYGGRRVKQRAHNMSGLANSDGYYVYGLKAGWSSDTYYPIVRYGSNGARDTAFNPPDLYYKGTKSAWVHKAVSDAQGNLYLSGNFDAVKVGGTMVPIKSPAKFTKTGALDPKFTPDIDTIELAPYFDNTNFTSSAVNAVTPSDAIVNDLGYAIFGNGRFWLLDKITGKSLW